MVDEKRPFCFFVLDILLLCSSLFLSVQGQYYSSSASLSTSWFIGPFQSTPYLSPILMRETNFCFGFYCKSNVDECVLGVLISPADWDYYYDDVYLRYSELVWSANRNNPVQANSTLQLKQDGDLVLENFDGTLVWSSNTGGKSVAGLNLTEEGNLVLFGTNNELIWQSFDYPTDALLLGQRLVPGQKLTANVSESNSSAGLFTLSVDQDRLVAYVESNPPQIYLSSMLDGRSYVEFTNGSFNGWNIPTTSALQFLKFGFDGRLKLFQFTGEYWTDMADLFATRLGDCGYPTVCGNYGVCSNGNCVCPVTEANGDGSFFNQIDHWEPHLGCSLVTPISCSHSQEHSLLELKNTSYFEFEASFVKMFEEKAVDECRNMCLSNCSCKAALFVLPLDYSVGTIPRKGRCLLLNEVFSVIHETNNILTNNNYAGKTLFLKVQTAQVISRGKKKVIVIVAAAIGAFFGVLCLVGSCLVHCMKRSKKFDQIEGDFLGEVPGMPDRYSYQDLKVMTENFSKKLGEGGFGSVYEGTLGKGTKIAVKCLHGLSQVKDSFLDEIRAIGCLHHVNLVNLTGFCFEKSHQLLVFEYMENGSLDRWIFDPDQGHPLPWFTRRKIISDIAKGLAYLHEDCSQKIIHFDIKPQNILLAQDFTAKVSDFGLSKLIEKDQSKVVTRMRGTPGYLAPEWLSSVITEKVDVYSFGVVILEIICGRKNLDWSKDEEDRHLLGLFKRKAEEERLEDLVDKRAEDMQIHIEEALEMMKMAAWCLQSDYTKRPTMSLLVKVLEGLVAAETDLDYNFTNPSLVRTVVAVQERQQAINPSSILPSVLSQPR